MYSFEIFETWIAPSVSPVISRLFPWTAATVASAIELRMSEITPYTTSPTFSSARGLKGRTRATKFCPSSSRSPGNAAQIWPSFSYVPSPASYSSAAAIASPGRTILRSNAPSVSMGGRDRWLLHS